MFSSPDPILILGAPRSGTTYLRALVNAHPRIVLTRESRILNWMRRSFDLASDDSVVSQHRAEFVAFLRRELPDQIRKFYRSLDSEACYWGDKNPRYAAHPETLTRIHEFFPASRYIHIVRDPRAVVASLLQKRHDAGGRPWATPEQAHSIAVGHVQTAADFGTAVGNRQYLELRHEDLVGDDLGQARAIFEWLEIPLAPEVEKFCREQMRQRTAFSEPTGPIAGRATTERLAAWRAAVGEGRLRESLEFLAPALLARHYETPESLHSLMADLA